ncbi:hypothetical protein [Kutzneria sp. CA-103260]|uniref:hypothetical protein n=1 Tax=Kutzneria sp. CA-103260 TaxID=2802641 RepID=UPI001BAD9D46|nr:hypothetical protein [Kutzneria sp. CA-103260]QUQ66253.1 hypothetical protein JJ691_39800 [Kutzneria sp. CA-103260]
MADSGWRYSLRAALVGGGLAALWIAFAFTASTTVCRNSWTCAIVLIYGYWAMPAIGALVAWPVTRWAGLRPAWLVALLGSGIGLAGLFARDSFGFQPTLTSPWLVPIEAIGFVVAAWVVVTRIPLVWRALLLVLVLLPLPVAELTAGIRANSAKQDTLAQAGVPLYGPDVPAGYQIRFAGNIGYGEHKFFYSIEPTAIGTKPDPNTEDETSVRVTVAAVSPSFAPPDHCTFTGSIAEGDRVPPCPSVGTDMWRWNSKDGSYVSYFVRRDGVGVEIERHSDKVPEDILRGIARTLAVRDPSYFTGG